jgi:thiol peroxidase
MMKNAVLIGMLVWGVMACGMMRAHTLTVAEESVPSGDGHGVTFHGSPLTLEGTSIKVGDTLPAVHVTGVDSNSGNVADLKTVNLADLRLVNLANTKGKVRIISVIPSLDTPVCEQQTHILSEKNGGLDKQVQLITVSMDLPFTQTRFSNEAKIHNVLFLSDYKAAEFGTATGLLIGSLHVLTRAVLVVDRDNVIRYMQVVPEITNLPDMEAAMKAARTLLSEM